MLDILIMDAKQKATELTDKFFHWYADEFYFSYTLAKEAANMCVDEILNDNPNIYDSDRLNHKYWKEVKRQISLL